MEAVLIGRFMDNFKSAGRGGAVLTYEEITLETEEATVHSVRMELPLRVPFLSRWEKESDPSPGSKSDADLRALVGTTGRERGVEKGA